MKLPKNWIMWIIAVGFFAFQFLLRIFPGLVVQDLMTQFRIDASSFAFLSAAYYFGYAGMQIPIGILLDRFQIRYVIAGCALLCSIGTFLFSFSNIWGVVVFGRFLTGVGSAAGFLGAAKLVRTGFSAERFTTMIGLTFSLGLTGALYGGKPMSMLVEAMGWRTVLELLSLTSLLLAASMFFFFPKSDSEHSSPRLKDSLQQILKTPKVLWVALAGAMMVGPLEGFADIWGISYFVNVRGVAKHEASLVTSFIYVGMLMGGPILSYLAKKFGSLYSVTTFCGLGMGALFVFILFYPDSFSQPSLMLMMTLIGIMCCYQVTVLGIACEIVPPSLVGLATSVTNCINMASGCLIHSLMGWAMDLQWAGELKDGMKIYPDQSYLGAVSVIPAMLFLGCFGFLLLSKNTARQQKIEMA